MGTTSSAVVTEHGWATETSPSILAGRVLVIYGLLGILGRGRREQHVEVSGRHAMLWGGLRGSIPIALVLGLGVHQPEFGGVDPVAVVFAVVFASLVGQGRFLRRIAI